MSYQIEKLKNIALIKTGKLDSNAAVSDGTYPFFTCDPITLKIDDWAYDTEAVLLAGNNASGNYTAKYYKGKFNAYQRTYIIESANTSLLSVRFLAFAITQQLRLLKAMSTGSTTKFLTIKMLNDLEIPCPEITTQRKIASIIGSYDDLIENNQNQIKLLEEIAQRLYKEWFIDLRFPGHENVEIVDGVPVKWHYKSLKEISTLRAGGDKPKNFSKTPDSKHSIPIYSNGTVNDGLYGYTDMAEITDDSITITARGSIGYTCLRREPYVPIVRLISIIPNMIDVIYLFLSLKNQEFDSNGAAQQQLTVPMVSDYKVLIPDKGVLNNFLKIVYPIFEKIDLLKYQLLGLVEARDRLLPKLISGEIEV